MKSNLKLATLVATSVLLACAPAIAQTPISQPRQLNQESQGKRIKAESAELSTSGIVRRIENKTVFIGDEYGNNYKVVLPDGVTPPPLNRRVKIKISITIRPPGGSIEISWQTKK